MNNALIIFAKSPVYGKVKTRLAATVGNDKALDIYKKLFQYTMSVINNITCNKIIFYSDEMMDNSDWDNNYQKKLQHGNDLGERMMNAFHYCFDNDYSNAVIIGTDCPELTAVIIKKTFEKLQTHDVVVGEAADGGYYLLGMKKMHELLFKNMEWSTDKVFSETIKRISQLQLSYFQLPLLHDVDEEKDLNYMQHLL